MSGPSAPSSIDEVVFPELSPSVDSVSDTLSSPIPESASDTSSMSAFKEFVWSVVSISLVSKSLVSVDMSTDLEAVGVLLPELPDTFVSPTVTLVPPTLTLTLITGVGDGDEGAVANGSEVSLEKEMPSSPGPEEEPQLILLNGATPSKIGPNFTSCPRLQAEGVKLFPDSVAFQGP